MCWDDDARNRVHIDPGNPERDFEEEAWQARDMADMYQAELNAERAGLFDAPDAYYGDRDEIHPGDAGAEDDSDGSAPASGVWSWPATETGTHVAEHDSGEVRDNPHYPHPRHAAEWPHAF